MKTSTRNSVLVILLSILFLPKSQAEELNHQEMSALFSENVRHRLWIEGFEGSLLRSLRDRLCLSIQM